MSLKKTLSTKFKTMGVVVDLHNEEGRSLAETTARQTRDPEFRNFLLLAQGLGKRYLVAAGQFNGKGIFATFCDDDTNLVLAFQMANSRMDEIGSGTTGWLVKPDTCAALIQAAAGQPAKTRGKP